MSSKRRRSPRQARSTALVEAIVEAAARVFDREGLAATTSRIAAEAGVSIGSLYQYFANKEALLEAVAHRHLDEGEALLAELRVGLKGSTEVSSIVDGYVNALAAHHLRHPRTHALFEAFVARSPALLDRVRTLKAAVAEDLESHLRRIRPQLPNPALKASLVAAALGSGTHDAVLGSQSFDVAKAELGALCKRYLD